MMDCCVNSPCTYKIIVNKVLVEVLVILFIVNYCSGGDIGSTCIIRHSGIKGVCDYENCSSAVEDKRNKIPLTICSKGRRMSIVCCDKSREKKVLPVGEISKRKCEEYGKHAYFERKGRFGKLIKGLYCGKVKLFIVNGEKTSPQEFPHQALLGYYIGREVQWKCGGSLISENFVITAAHCLQAATGDRVRLVRLGELDYDTVTDYAGPETFGIERKIKHPAYRPPRVYNDIALIKLNKTVTFNRFIRPICLSTENVNDESKTEGDLRFIATGFGKREYNGIKNTDLRKVVLDSFSIKYCNAYFADTSTSYRIPRGIDKTSQLCAGGATSQGDTCQGDSGGPLQIYHDDVPCMYKLVGITSFGKYCGGIGVPGIYTRVFHYIEWIEQEVWEGSI